MITVIIPVRNRSIQRLDRCVKSFINQPLVKECLIIDYGSKIPIKYKREKVKVIRFPLENNKFFSKAHALNIGFKLAKTDYVCTIDVDMIIHPRFMNEVRRYIDPNCFFYCRRVRRLECKHLNQGTFKDWSRKATAWTSSGGMRVYKDDLRHFATGGIQIFPTKWIRKIRGIDENLVGLGGMDNFTIEMAYETGLNLIVINKKILHQEHKKKKEAQFDEDQRKFLEMVRIKRKNYLLTTIQDKKKYNKGYWGSLKRPNQSLIMKQEKAYLQGKFDVELESYPKHRQKMIKLINKGNLTRVRLEKKLKKFAKAKNKKIQIVWPKK